MKAKKEAEAAKQVVVESESTANAVDAAEAPAKEAPQEAPAAEEVKPEEEKPAEAPAEEKTPAAEKKE